MKDVKDLESRYLDFSRKSKDIARQLANSVSMLQLDEINEEVAKAVVQIESLSNKGEEKSFWEKIPALGKYMRKVKDSVDQEQLENGKMVDIVDRLFDSLNAKNENIMQVAETLYNIREQLVEDLHELEEQENLASELIETEGFDSFKAKNLLVQVQQVIINTKDRVSIIDATVKSAEASSTTISSLLPSLQGEFIAEMAIQAGLQELKEFKQTFDTTIEVVNNLSHKNSDAMKAVMLDVVDLAISRPKDQARLENLNSKRMQFQEQLKDKMERAKIDQQKSLKILSTVRADQTNLLGNYNVRET